MRTTKQSDTTSYHTNDTVYKISLQRNRTITLNCYFSIISGIFSSAQMGFEPLILCGGQRSTIELCPRRLLIFYLINPAPTKLDTTFVLLFQEGDKYVLIGGMVLTCIVMFLVIRFFT